jgi:Fungal specific transcription factor domain
MNMKELELLHHWSIFTSVSIAGRQEMKDLFQIEVPRLACQHPILMRGLLALSASHLSRLQLGSREEYGILSARYLNRALAEFQSNVSDISERNCHMAIIFSILLTLYTCASTPNIESSASEYWESATRWIRLLRGTLVIIRSSQHWLWHGPLGPTMRKIRPPNLDLTETIDDDSWLFALLPMLNPNASSSSLPENTKDDLRTCRVAHFQLRMTFVRCKTPTNVGDVCAWPLGVPHEFMALLDRKCPEALILLAYYCVLLKRFESYWFFNGHAERLLSVVRQELGREWLHWLEWPTQVVGV